MKKATKTILSVLLLCLFFTIPTPLCAEEHAGGRSAAIPFPTVKTEDQIIHNEVSRKAKIGQVLEYNGQGQTEASRRNWGNRKDHKNDFWRYQVYDYEAKDYIPMSSSGTYWSQTGKSLGGPGGALVTEYGRGFVPTEKQDAVKLFRCLEGGTLEIRTVVIRKTACKPGRDPASFSIYLDDRKVYPETEDALLLSDTTKNEITLTLTVEQGQMLYFRIGAVGNRYDDLVLMENYATYKAFAEIKHEWGKTKVLQKATCTMDGAEGRICLACDVEWVEKVLPATGHRYSDDVTVLNEATPYNHGKEIHTCTVCGESEERTVPPLEAIRTVPEEIETSLGLRIGLLAGGTFGLLLGAVLTLVLLSPRKGS